MNREPLLPITEEDAQTYERDGVVCLRKVFDRDWIDLLLPEAERVLEDRVACGLIPNAGIKNMSRVMPGFRRAVFESPAAEAAGRVMRSKEIRFFYDEIFAKNVGGTYDTYWHTDRAGWPVSGQMVPSFWFPLTPVEKTGCVEILAGSHTDGTLYWNTTGNSRKMQRPDERPLFPDYELRRDDPSLQFLAWDMDPGDALVIHPWAFHYGRSVEGVRRIAVSMRFFGDDIRWDPRPECVNHAGVSFDEMVTGQKPGGSVFPLLWSEDGRRDGDANFPRGFATSWDPDPEIYKTDTKVGGGAFHDPNYGDRLKQSA